MMVKRSTRTITVEHRSMPTPERMARAGSDFEVGGDERTGKVIRVLDSPLDRMRSRGAIDPVEYQALQRFKHHWHHGGLAPAVGSVDLNRVFASDPLSHSGMARSERQAHHRDQWRKACAILGHRSRITVENVVCAEQTLAIAGLALGWDSKPQAIAAASEILRDAGYRLAKLWGIG